MGISANATVHEPIHGHRRRKHRVSLLNRIEEMIAVQKIKTEQEEDIAVWKYQEDQYKAKFSTKSTWLILREAYIKCGWDKAVWFSYATPKYAFIHWVAMHDRLSTGSRMLQWNGNINSECVFCRDPVETREHLFFECQFSTEIWKALTKGFLREQYTAKWSEILQLILASSQQRVPKFNLQYVFQAALYTIWRERNRRRHGDKPSSANRLIYLLDKNIRNRFTTIQRMGDDKYEVGMRFWFATRSIA